jgi:hypothetical protein
MGAEKRAMRLLRGPFFVIACLLAVAVGLGVGSGWFQRAARKIEQSPATLGLGAPPGPIRLFDEKEYQAYRRRLERAVEGGLPEHTDLFSQIGEQDFTLDLAKPCERFFYPKRCDVESMTPFFRALLESDPKIEHFMLVRNWSRGNPRGGGIRTAFILGKDGKLKIVVEAPGEVRELAARVIAGGAGEDRRIVFGLVDRSNRPDWSVYPPEPKSWAVFMADDPGELKALADGSPPALFLEDASAGGEPRTLWKLTITPGLAQRHRFFAVLKGKPDP